MKMDIVAGSKNDEFYTPTYAVFPILPHLKKFKRIWLPFDTPESNFIRPIEKLGVEVIATHISTGTDFFASWVECDAIVSNPPYSLKTEVFERLFYFGKPFAMLVGVVGLFESKRRVEMWSKNEFEILYLSPRVSYLKSYSDENPQLNPPFQSVYVTHNILPKKTMFSHINKGVKP